MNCASSLIELQVDIENTVGSGNARRGASLQQSSRFCDVPLWPNLFGAIRITGIVERTAVILDRTAVSFWGQTSQILTSLSPKRGCGPRRVEQYSVTLLSNIRVFASVARPAM